MMTALQLAATLPLFVLPILELQVHTYASLDAANLAVARQRTETLLGTAGIRIIWRVCAEGNCAKPPFGVSSLVVRLLPAVSAIDPTRTGEVVRDEGSATTQILVYLGRNAAMAEKMRLLTGDLVGLTIAHEVGHVLGLPHSASGPMKAQFNPADVVRARTSAFRFSKTAGATMRARLGGR